MALARLTEVYVHRDLIRNFAARNLKLRYKGSLLGFVWSFLTPLLQMLVYVVVFSVILRVETDYPFPIFLLSGLLPWIFFQTSLMLASGAVIENANLIKKTYFPREVIPFSSVAANLVNFAISLTLLFIFLAYYRIPLRPGLLLLPAVIAIHLLLTLGLALAVSCLTVFFRDIQHMLEVALLLWMFASPIVYPIKGYVGPELLPYYRLNPMVEIVELYRSALLYGRFPAPGEFLYPLAFGLAAFVAGYLVFARLEPRFAKEL